MWVFPLTNNTETGRGPAAARTRIPAEGPFTALLSTDKLDLSAKAVEEMVRVLRENGF